MYSNHQPRIQEFARDNADNLARTLWLAVMSANTPLYTVAGLIDDMENGIQSTVSMRINACRLIWDDREEIYAQCEDIYFHAEDWEDGSNRMLQYLATLPGLNVIKAGFAAQLAYGLSGCLDTHNIRRYDLAPRAFANYKQRRTNAGRRTMVHKYNALVAKLGGTEKLWDNWCEYVAERNPKAYPTPEYASNLHCEILGV